MAAVLSDRHGVVLRDSERRAQLSYGMVRVITFFALGWVFLGLYLHSMPLTGAAMVALTGFIAAWILHALGKVVLAGIIWVVMTATAITLGSFIVDRAGMLDMMLVITLCVPFAIFSTERQPFLVYPLSAVSIVFWLVIYVSGHSLLGPPDIDADVAGRFAAPASGITVLGVIAFVVAYIERVNLRNTRALQRALIEADQAAEAKSAFLAAMNHELRTPLNAIIGLAELSALDPETNYGTQIRDSGMRLLRLIEKGIAYSDVSGGQFNYTATDFALGEAAAAAISQAEETTNSPASTCTLVGDLGTMVHSDRGAVEAIVEHLIENAILYGNRQQPVRVECDNSDPETVSVLVTNTGEGFPAGFSFNAIETFQRHTRTNSNISGLGVGLKIAFILSRGLGARLTVDESNRHETRVRLILPRKSVV